MSSEKSRSEALRWIKTAEDDLDSADILLRNKKFAHSCFHSQQAGEKAVKAIWYARDLDPWGHSIARLIRELETADPKAYGDLAPLLKTGMILDRFYIPTRYPNGLPDVTPDVAFSEDDAKGCIGHATEIVENVKAQLKF